MHSEEQLPWEKKIKTELANLEEISQKRQLVTTKFAEQPWLMIDGRRMLNLASNNYLGYAGDERLKKAMIDAVHTYGAGATASRLIIGNHPLYEQAEQVLVNWKNAEAGLIINSGYTANLGIISTLLSRNDFIFSDKLNHASIVDGALLSRAKHKRYRHNDLTHLEALLKNASIESNKLIVTDTVFSMDGDFAFLEDLVWLKERYNAILMTDEAHGSGIYGKNGEGYAYHLGLQNKVDIQMGTFSKALGSFGAYVVGKKWLIDYLKNRMRGFIYSTALPPAILSSIKTAIELVQEEPERRTLLQTHSEYFRKELTNYGFNICGSQSQIVPIVIGENEKAMGFATRLQKEGIAGIAVRPPTVPENEARIRFTVTALHDKKDLDWAIEKVSIIGKEMGVIE
ncbi:8-amino-7-oxononanoate synthase [Peribacillus sp. Bi96]|uniref:8-amino-7-oxononanoate synthase n=1 Tax=unclassified Peribacillus TaxID=2675266 RepID=UPI001D594F55|nr:8-amino-7-oxononanoate synthase [Peribacillus sp. Bi96]CAH0287048.1 8-amino-7-oxononanoate synthase [Peribacillus sp. Bi96]